MLRVRERKIGLWIMGDDPARMGLARGAVIPANLLVAYWDKQLTYARNEIWLSDASQLGVEKCFYVCESDWHAA